MSNATGDLSRSLSISDPADRFDRTKVAEFVVRDPQIVLSDDATTIQLPYALCDVSGDVIVEFVEIVQLDGTSVGTLGSVAAYAQLLALVCAPSYFKTSIAPTIRVDFALAPAFRTLLERLLTDGLGEFAFVNSLDMRSAPLIVDSDRQSVSVLASDEVSVPVGDANRVLLPIGGGKDSLVSYQVLVRAGFDVVPFAVNASAPITRCTDMMREVLVSPRRTIDPLLLRLNAQASRDPSIGALNGHVPVTAINSVVAAITAAAAGIGWVAFSNERSASFGNVEYLGKTINHQWSKSVEAEYLIRSALGGISGAPTVFSLLRPYSEFVIARAFARDAVWLDVFTSCNRAFVRDPNRRVQRWCCECPKCRFVFLLLAPFVGRRRVVEIFGYDLLADPTHVDGFLELLGVGKIKPFECVGEPDECRDALSLLVAAGEWTGAAGFDEVVGRAQVGHSDALVAQPPVSESDFGLVPSKFHAPLRKYFEGVGG